MNYVILFFSLTGLFHLSTLLRCTLFADTKGIKNSLHWPVTFFFFWCCFYCSNLKSVSLNCRLVFEFGWKNENRWLNIIFFFYFTTKHRRLSELISHCYDALHSERRSVINAVTLPSGSSSHCTAVLTDSSSSSFTWLVCWESVCFIVIVLSFHIFFLTHFPCCLLYVQMCAYILLSNKKNVFMKKGRGSLNSWFFCVHVPFHWVFHRESSYVGLRWSLNEWVFWGKWWRFGDKKPCK